MNLIQENGLTAVSLRFRAVEPLKDKTLRSRVDQWWPTCFFKWFERGHIPKTGLNRLKPVKTDWNNFKSTESISLGSIGVGFLIIQLHFNNTKLSFLSFFQFNVTWWGQKWVTCNEKHQRSDKKSQPPLPDPSGIIGRDLGFIKWIDPECHNDAT